MTRFGAAVGLAAALLLCFPSAHAGGGGGGDAVTTQVANRLHGTHRTAWEATTFDCCGTVTYTGPRRAVMVKIPRRHGTRWVGVIHVPNRNATAALAALASKGVWFAKSGGRIVLPLESSTDTSGEPSLACRRAARWAAGRLGEGWAVVGP